MVIKDMIVESRTITDREIMDIRFIVAMYLKYKNMQSVEMMIYRLEETDIFVHKLTDNHIKLTYKNYHAVCNSEGELVIKDLNLFRFIETELAYAK
jgi:hypothetical protein